MVTKFKVVSVYTGPHSTCLDVSLCLSTCITVSQFISIPPPPNYLSIQVAQLYLNIQETYELPFFWFGFVFDPQGIELTISLR